MFIYDFVPQLDLNKKSYANVYHLIMKRTCFQNVKNQNF